MFTGIVEELGEVVDLELGPESARLRLRGPLVVSDARHGASIAVSGVCLTVTDHDDETFAVDVMAETLRRSSLGALKVGDAVNLERAMAASGRFGGHVVQGHVDGVGTIVARTPGDRWEVVEVAVPADLAHYVVEKGSVTVDGEGVGHRRRRVADRLGRQRPGRRHLARGLAHPDHPCPDHAGLTAGR